MDSCGGCRKPIKGSSIQCNVCRLWFDLRCSGADQHTIDFLNSPSGQKGSVHWYCGPCESGSKELQEMVVALTRRVSHIETKVDDLKKSVDTISSKIDGLSTADVSTNNSGSATNATSKPTAGMVVEIATEIKEREKKLLDVVFVGNVAKEKVSKFLNYAECEDTSIKEIKTKADKPLFIVTLKTVEQKWLLVKKARGISQSKDGMENIYVNPDLTKTEREVQYQLRQEAKRRRSLGESVKMSRGKIVKLDK